MTEREMIGQQIPYNKNSMHRNLLNIDDFFCDALMIFLMKDM